MLGLVLSVLFICLFNDFNVKGDSGETLFMEYIEECGEEYTLTPEDMKDLESSTMPKSEGARCFFACAFKKAKMMNDKGEFWIEGVKEVTQKHYGNNETIMNNVNKYIDMCKNVNDIPVSDGEKGCERAVLMFQCNKEHASEIGFV